MDLVLDDLVCVVREHAIPDREFDFQLHAGPPIADDERLKADLPALEMRRPGDMSDVRLRHLFDPNRLPDSRRARVPNTMRMALPILLSARLGKVMRIVERVHGHDL